jgi:RNA polymerase sigma-70 factor (ECF subfamily)
MTKPDEDTLIENAKRGDLNSFNELVLVYQGQVFALACRLLGDPEDAADIAQEAFLSAFLHIGGFRKGSFRAWILRIATNLCYDALRRRKSRPTSPLEILFTRPHPSEAEEESAIGTSPAANAERRELAERIQQGLQTLPAEQRLVVVLCDIEGFAYREAARIAGISQGTLKSRLSRGRSRLREFFFGHPEHLPPSFRSILGRAFVENRSESPAHGPEDVQDETG